jgi:hypothetical protein
VNVTVPLLSDTVPCCGFCTTVSCRVAPGSTSVSFASSVVAGMSSGVPSGVVAVSSIATGASSTGVTVTTTCATSVAVPSLAV